jgi:hypothetical protein
MRIPNIPHTKMGIETPNRAKVVTPISAMEYGFRAEYMPTKIAMITAMANAVSWILRVSMAHGVMRDTTGWS